MRPDEHWRQMLSDADYAAFKMLVKVVAAQRDCRRRQLAETGW